MTAARLLDHLAASLEAGERMVWIGVAAVHGSAPRAPGTRMLVGMGSTFGTIGGGRLELRAIEIARGMIVDDAAGLAPPPRIERFPLGASVGQCCGGVMHLAFDVVRPTEHAWVDEARALARADIEWVRILSLCGQPVRVARLSELQSGTADAANAARIAATPGDGAAICGDHMVIELMRPAELHLALFGAGHVGRALIEVLSRLPIRVTWIDPRESEFLAWMPHNTRPVLTDMPEAEVRHQPANTAVLITTHSHALDLELVRTWLDRGDFGFLGLIGSTAKRANFEAKLRARGYTDDQLARIVSPVGDPAVVGKEPEVIAIAIAAQLMSLRSKPQNVRHIRQDHPAKACTTP
ncbi:MAG: xanthine dehydrogenase accessory protein XdhC [Azoarcus sp.]|jgi:xanthine dehydrogenase accessory factor|nr:xanthine dehydrogenase accessory protein XdhC [Azoarcus sp.]